MAGEEETTAPMIGLLASEAADGALISPITSPVKADPALPLSIDVISPQSPPQPQPSQPPPSIARIESAPIVSPEKASMGTTYVFQPRTIASVAAPAQHTITTTTTSNNGGGGGLTIASPLRYGRSARTQSRVLSRDSSKDSLHLFSPTQSMPTPSPPSLQIPMASSTSTSSLTTTSIFHTSPHPPGAHSHTHSPVRHVISTTTSYTVADDSPTTTKLPNVGGAQSTTSSTSALLAAAAAATKDITPMNLPTIVSAHQTRIAALEATTSAQAEHIVELRHLVQNLQKQLVMVMAQLPSTSGTGGVRSIIASPHGTPRGAASGSFGTEPYRSRSSTELRYAAAQKRLSGGAGTGSRATSNGSTPRTPQTPRGTGATNDIVVDRFHFAPGARTNSTESLHSNGSATSYGRSSQPRTPTGAAARSSRTSKKPARNSVANNFISPRQPSHTLSSSQQQQQHTAVAQQKAGTSHHFSFHPQISTQAPPGQIPVEPVQLRSSMTPAAPKRERLHVNSPPPPSTDRAFQPILPTASDSTAQPTTVAVARNPARRLTPVESFNIAAGAAVAPSHSFVSSDETHSHTRITSPMQYSAPAYGQQPAMMLSPHAAAYQTPPSGPASSSTFYSPSFDLSSPSGSSQFSPYHQHDVLPSPLTSPDSHRPLPVQHIVTHGKHGMTEYVLSMRDETTTGVVSPSASSPQQQQAVFDAPPPVTKKEKEKKEKKKKKEKHDEHGDTPADEAAAAVRTARRGTKERKLCKVPGCTEYRALAEKYCRMHGMPAPSNPNARKMLFQH